MPRPPIHILSAVVTIVLDLFWGVLQGGAIVPVLTMPLLIGFSLITFGSCLWCVFCVQRFVAHDSRMAAITKGLVMGVIAGIPFMVTGTFVGVVLLGWAGLSTATRQLEQKKQS